MASKTALGALGALAGGPIGAIAGWFGGNDGDEERKRYEAEQARLREQSKTTQLGYVNQMQGPSVSDATKRRIKALEDESQKTSLVEDPYFQAQRATLVQGGQQALSSTQNAHAAYGTTGGFSNQGSAADIYDRLGSQLAGLGQQSANLKDQKSQQAAQMQQSITDAQIEFQNAQLKARAAIEAGDTAAASQAMSEAFQARQKAEAAQNAMIGGLIGTGATAAGAILGGPAGAAAGKTAGNAFSASVQGPAAQQVSDLPWAARRGQYA